ncbi:MAG TPA: cytochrome c oxidase assembly protein [Pararhizobium sp.]|nr:cytochrome c oxidase assembly protein [Pararhizobium sp.]
MVQQEAALPYRVPARDYGVYGIIVLGGLLLWWLSAFHAALMPSFGPWDFSWLWYLAAALACFWYARGLARLSRRAQPPLWRSVCYFLGIGAIYIVLQTHFDYLAQHMFFLNRVQHIVMHHLGPFLIAIAWPGGVLKRGMPEPLVQASSHPAARFVVRVLQQPFVAAFLFVGLIILWLLPPIHFRAMIDPRLYAVMNWSMVVDGILFWLLVLDPRPAPPAFCSYPVRIITVVLIMFPQIATGALIAFSHHDIYSFYAWCGRAFPSIGALDDQQYGGLIIWIPAAMMSVVALLVIINMLRLNEEREERGSVDESGHEGLVISSKAWTGERPGRKPETGGW